jgi:hypothetical protein
LAAPGGQSDAHGPDTQELGVPGGPSDPSGNDGAQGNGPQADPAAGSNGTAGGSNGNNKKDGGDADALSSTGSAGGQSNQGGTSGNGPAAGGGKHAFDPDPPPQQSPPATTGPTDCPGYSQETGGSYDHDNCDGSQGLNGNGGNGKCAGCTGKADDKSPGGQYSGDHNNGYECDHNKGVGKGNPAHSKCSTTSPPCTVNCNPCTSNCNPCRSNCNPCTSNCNPGCQTNCNPGCQTNCNPGCQTNCNPDCLDVLPADECDDDEVLGKVIRRSVPSIRSADAAEQPAVAAGAVLPFTGGDPVPVLLIGLALIAFGSAITLQVGRKRRRSAYLDREGLRIP